ncbi:MAG: fused MFS/spermidine synthase [Solirubrobacterales bacterium]|nr:fused MFS/spermidine synthase [Solirubrobacterales bacterium]
MPRAGSRYLGLLVFTVGACTMGTEIAGARLLAPYFGDSTIVWANTIAVVLVALSIGYWLGGRLADRRPELRDLCAAVLVGATLITLIPFLARPFLGASVDAFDELSVGAFAGSLVGVLVLLAVPVMILGSVSPWALRIAMSGADLGESGQLAGRLYALSTAGSLVGTMVSALVTIPLLGTQRTFIVFALVVAVVAAVGLRKLWPALVPAAVACAALVPVGTIKAAGDGEVIFEAETPHQYIRVVEEDGERRLELNEGQAIHSIYRPGEYLVGNYWDEHLVLPFVAAPTVTGTAGADRGPGWPRRVAILGNAAGTVARAYGRFYPETKVDAVEIDGKLTEVGRRYFGLDNPNMEVHTADARPWLRSADPVYDVIMVDAYHQPYIPFYLATKEFFELVRDRLAPGGVVLINVGHPEQSDALEKNLTATMREALPFSLRDPVTETNTMLVGSADPIAAENILLASEGRRSPIPNRLDSLARDTALRIREPLEGGDVWTDDHAPVEWLVDLSLLEYANE